MQHRVRECIAQTGPYEQSVAKRRSLAAPRFYVRREYIHTSTSTYQESKTAVRLSRVHFKIWVAQGLLLCCAGTQCRPWMRRFILLGRLSPPSLA